MVPRLPFMYVVLCVLKIQGVSCQAWRATLTHLHICAVRGSSVAMPCSYTHPPGLTITKVFWTTNPKRNIEPIDLLDMPDYKGRVEYSPDIDKNCSLTLSNLMLGDAREYKPRILTDNTEQKWLQSPGIHLKVTDINVLFPRPVTEGSEVKMNCSHSCRVKDNLPVIWRKNGEDLPGTAGNDNGLILVNVSTEDVGNYSCALRAYEGHPSSPVKLDVMFAPKNTAMTVSPSHNVSEGDTVTLTCSSDANPPVENYTWFKVNESTPVGSGQQYRISNISSEDGGQYYCEARNKYGARNSSPVLVTVKVPPGEQQNYKAFALIGVIAAAVVGISCAIHLIRTKTKKKTVVQSQTAGPPCAEGAANACLYSTIRPHGARQTGDTQIAQEDEVHYAIVYFSKPGERVTVRPEEALNTIYCNAQEGT